MAPKGHKGEQSSLWVVVQSEIQCRYDDQAIQRASGEPRGHCVHVARIIPTPNSCTYC